MLISIWLFYPNPSSSFILVKKDPKDKSEFNFLGIIYSLLKSVSIPQWGLIPIVYLGIILLFQVK